MSKLLIAIVAAIGVVPPLFAQSAVPNPHGTLALPCQNCHTTTSWSPLRAQPEFSHNADTHYPLRGMHTDVACNSCHVSKIFTEASTRCADCHADFHKRQFGAQCENCHTVLGWRVNARPIQDHWNRFPLLGAHAAVQCESCHPGAAVGKYTGLSTQCYSCHQRDYEQTQVLDHRAAGFPVTCETCHNADRWQIARFDHARFAHFALTGSHQNLACAQCHTAGRFQGTPTDCISCHVNDFTKAANPNHVAAGFPRDCATCHTTATWQGATFDHAAKTGFALAGAHASASCVSCHVGGRFAGTPTECSGCHIPDYDKTTNPNHRQAGFPLKCDTCHTVSSWQGAKFDHNLTKFPLTGAHTTATCTQCHTSGQFAAISTDCVSCHLKDYQSATSPNHVAAQFPQTCALCHTTTQWQGAKFDHSLTKFPLTGAHTTATCTQCHTGGQFTAISTDCVSCHLKDYQGTTNPNHVAAQFPQNCTFCHTTTQWQGAKFDHNTQTKFALTGAHTSATCNQCHSSGVYQGLSTTCVSCHLKDYQGTNNPNHVAAGFPQDCQVCHATTQWLGAKFDHNLTKFPLTGSHTTATCTQCHTNGQFASLSTACSSCHLKEYQATTNPNHAAAGFPQDCQLCHTTIDWNGAKFDHTTQTTFALTGAHTTATCVQCHSSGVYKGLSTSCSSCHLNEYQGTTNPNHAAAGFPQDCQLCHTTTNWNGAKFDHTTQTTFPLTGAHTTATCVQCHSSGVYKGLSTSCSSCHLKEYQATTNPNHTAAAFPQDCQLCHTTTNWSGAKFDHTTQTTFALTGAHTTATCLQCHSSGVYKGLSTSCSSCHLNEYQGTTNPNHAAAGFPQDCQLCHTTTNWNGAKFDHTTQTTFPLTGAHTTATCLQCHSSGVYKGLSTSCSSCHLKEYQATTNPNHTAAAFPQDCQLCHSTTNWSGATFDHTTQTTFPLTGAHTTVTCLQCHSSGVYKGLSTTCSSCHLKDYQGTTNPNHAAAGFPQDCQLCHTTTNWSGATFNHTTQTKFPLTGAHTSATCLQCHSSGVYAGLSTACSSCHLKEYQATTNPNHAAAGFPQDCSLCHTTTNWTGATFDHSTTKFPLTGKHTTVACATCHVNNQYATLSTACYSCHAAAYQATTNPSHVAAGFPQDCSLCHTTTDWTGATFNHSTTGFTLTGKHTTTQCLQCHVGNKFAGTPTDCYSCHTTEYNSTTNPNHVAAGFPKTCDTCHTTTAWTGATFNHTWFPTNHGTANGVCSTCHTNSSDYSVFTCTNCHLKAITDSHHTGVRNYVYNSINCYSCHPAGRSGG